MPNLAKVPCLPRCASSFILATRCHCSAARIGIVLQTLSEADVQFARECRDLLQRQRLRALAKGRYRSLNLGSTSTHFALAALRSGVFNGMLMCAAYQFCGRWVFGILARIA
jgi:hypothetical protein